MDDNVQATGVVEMTTKDGAAPGPDDLLTTAQAAKIMGVTDSHVRRVIVAEQLDATRFGDRAWMVRRADAEAWAKVERRTGPKRGAAALAASRDPRLDMDYAFERGGSQEAEVVGIRATLENHETMAVADGSRDLSGGILTSAATGMQYRVVGPLGQTTFSIDDAGGAARLWIIESV